MSITDYQVTRFAEISLVTVTSDLGGTIYYHWYQDGKHVDATAWPFRAFWLPVGDSSRIEVVDTAEADFDWQAGAPDGYPARRTLWWTSAEWPDLEDDLDYYRVDQKTDGDWEAIGTVHQSRFRWDYSLLTERLDDLTEHTWRIVPVDRAGNDGDPLEVGPEMVVRTPDAPRFEIAFDEGTTKVTFSEAS